MLADSCNRHGVAARAYCLVQPRRTWSLSPDGGQALRRALGDALQRCTRAINLRQGWVGHLRQGRFASCALDAAHLVAAVRYVGLNAAGASLTERAEDWPWSSARAQLAEEDDGLSAPAPA